jgi:hypothetical protein
VYNISSYPIPLLLIFSPETLVEKSFLFFIILLSSCISSALQYHFAIKIMKLIFFLLTIQNKITTYKTNYHLYMISPLSNLDHHVFQRIIETQKSLLPSFSLFSSFDWFLILFLCTPSPFHVRGTSGRMEFTKSMKKL